MKRELLQNVKVAPYTSGGVIDRKGFLSLVFSAIAAAAGVITLTITHSDDGKNFETVKDERVFPEKPTKDGGFTTDTLAANDVVNIDVDLIGLKDFVKIEVTGAAAKDASFAYALGDSATQPV